MLNQNHVVFATLPETVQVETYWEVGLEMLMMQLGNTKQLPTQPMSALLTRGFLKILLCFGVGNVLRNQNKNPAVSVYKGKFRVVSVSKHGA